MTTTETFVPWEATGLSFEETGLLRVGSTCNLALSTLKLRGCYEIVSKDANGMVVKPA